jgi:hypothetical protein
LANVELTLTAEATADAAVDVTDAAGVAAFAGLQANAFALAVTGVPHEACAVDGALTVTVAADGSIAVTDESAGAGIEVGSFADSTNTLVIALPCDVTAEGTLAGTAAGGTAGGEGQLPDTAMTAPATSSVPSLMTALLALVPLGAIVGHSVIRFARRR